MLPGRVDAQGRLYVSQAAPAASDVYIGGIAHDIVTGAVRIALLPPTFFVNGFGVGPLGRLSYSPGAVINAWQQGYPFAADGSLVTVAMNAVPIATDPYVGGIRVHNLFGVYITDTIPVATDAWSDGFS